MLDWMLWTWLTACWAALLADREPPIIELMTFGSGSEASVAPSSAPCP